MTPRQVYDYVRQICNKTRDVVGANPTNTRNTITDWDKVALDLIASRRDIGIMGARNYPVDKLCTSILTKIETTDYLSQTPNDILKVIMTDVPYLTSMSSTSKQFQRLIKERNTQDLMEYPYDESRCNHKKRRCNKLKEFAFGGNIYSAYSTLSADMTHYGITARRNSLYGPISIDKITNRLALADPGDVEEIVWSCPCLIVSYGMTVASTMFDGTAYYRPESRPLVTSRKYRSKKGYFTYGDLFDLIARHYSEPPTEQEIAGYLKESILPPSTLRAPIRLKQYEYAYTREPYTDAQVYKNWVSRAFARSLFFSQVSLASPPGSHSINVYPE